MTNPTVTLAECMADILKNEESHGKIIDMYISMPMVMAFYTDGERRIYYIK